MMCAEKRSLTQPGWPKSHGSRWPLVKPQLSICLIAHSRGGLVVGRSGDPRPVHVGEQVQRPHDLRVAGLFLADLGVDVGVQLFLRLEGPPPATQGDKQDALQPWASPAGGY